MKLMQLIYRTNDEVEKCDETVHFAEPSKIIFSKKSVTIVKSLNWLLSKRRNFLVTSKSLFIGKEKINRDSICNISYFDFTSLLLFKYVVLKIKLVDESFIYVGMHKNSDLLSELSANTDLNNNNEIKYSHYFILSAIVLTILYFYIRH